MYERRGVLTRAMGIGAALLCGVWIAGCGLQERLGTKDADAGFGGLQWVSQGELLGDRDLNGFLGSDTQTIMRAGLRRSDEVILAPGDEVEIKFYFTPELDVRQVVRPDGNLSLLLVGEVKAEGKTPALLTDELIRGYKPHLKEPQVAVIIRSLYNRRVYVTGEVVTPGVVEMPGRLTLMEAIMGAGGFSVAEADTKHVIVIRQKGGIRCACKINMGPSLDGRSIHEPFYLFPKDVVFVPQTGIAKLNQWIDQHINKIVPRAIYFRFDPLD